MKFLAINGSPRRQWNTAQLLEQAVLGAEAAGAEAELVHLRDLAPFNGCISCFHCKDPKGRHYGRCILKDTLTPLLEKAHEADVLVFGTPVFLHAETGLFRNFLERLTFQYQLYSNVKGPLSPRKKGTALIYTMNAREEEILSRGYDKMTETTRSRMDRLFGACELFLCADTLQFKDYSRYETDRFDADAKRKRHEEVFPGELKRAFDLGKRLAS